MKSKFHKILTSLKRPKYFIPAGLAAIVILIVGKNILFPKDPNASLVTVAAARATVAQEVTATGNVKATEEVDLAFQTSGKIARINVKVGDHVKAGQMLATLSNASESAALSQEVARLAQLQIGARSEDLAVSQATLSSAKTDLTSAEEALAASINDAFTKVDDAVRNHSDKLYQHPETSPKFGGSFYSTSGTYEIKATDADTAVLLSNERTEVQKILESWPMPGGDTSLDVAAEEALADLKKVQTFLNDTSAEVNKLNSTSEAAEDFYSSLKSEMSTARGIIGPAITNLNSSIQAYKSKLSALNLANNQYSLKKAPPTNEELQIEEAAVEQARANLAKTIITAPFNGIVTKVPGTAGEIAGANTPEVSVISDSNLEIEVNIPEADIAKVMLKAPASITFDAYGKDFIALATVVSIDPAATVIDGVPTYRTVLEFNQPDQKIRSGMTANITIKGESKENVIAIPQRAVTTRDNEKFVQVLVNGKVEERTVTTGLRGSEGNIEIISGLGEGDMVITSGLKK